MTVTTQQIWIDFSNSLKQFIIRRVPTQADADDILQEVFHRIHKKLDTLNTEEKLQAWIYQITRNAITDYYRQQKITLELPETVEVGNEEAEANHPGACLKPMIDSLPEKYRQALVLTEFEGLSQKALAETLGLSFSGAKSRVQRAREQVKEKLLECCHLEFDRLGQVVNYQPRDSNCNNSEQNC